MERLGETLHRLLASQAPSSTISPPTPSMPTGTPPLAVEPIADPPCSYCDGRGWLATYAEVGDPNFGKVVPCTACRVGGTPSVDFFADLEVPTDRYASAIELARAMAAVPSGWLVVQGSIGSGKTTLARAVLSRWRGRWTNPETVAGWLAYWRGRVMDEGFEASFHDARNSSAAVLDDLGVERLTGWAAERLMMWLDWRYAGRLATVLTTNCDERTLAEHIDPRVADRVFDRRSGLVRVVTLDVPSFRTGRSW